MTVEKILLQLLEELKELEVNPQINLDDDPNTVIFADLQLDSLDILSLAMQLEDAFNIEIDINDLPRDESLRALSEHLLKLSD